MKTIKTFVICVVVCILFSGVELVVLILSGSENEALAQFEPEKIVYPGDDLVAVVNNCYGCTIALMDGTHEIAEQLVLRPKSSLIGTNKNTVIIEAKSAFHMINMKDNTTIKHLTILGNKSGNAEAAGLFMHDSTGCLVENVTIQNHSGQGIELRRADHNRFNSVDLINNDHRGINISENSHHNIMRDIVGSGNGKADILIGHGSHHNLVSNTVLKGMIEANPNFWIHEGSYNNSVNNVTILASDQNKHKGGLIIWNARYNTISNVHFTGFETAIKVYATTLDTPYSNISNQDTRDNLFSQCIIDNRHSKGSTAILLHAFAQSECLYVNCDPTDRRSIKGTVFANTVVNNFDYTHNINDSSRVLDTSFSNTTTRNITNFQYLPWKNHMYR